MSVDLPANCLTYRQIAGAGFGAGSAPARRVPVLFSTSRGLYLRVAQPTEGTGMHGGQHYDITFCDLERWVIKRDYCFHSCLTHSLFLFLTEHKSR